MAQVVECFHMLGLFPALYKPGMMVHGCNSPTYQVEVGGLEV